MRVPITTAFGLAMLLIATERAWAHGGQYRGPASVVPPTPGASSSSGGGNAPSGGTTKGGGAVPTTPASTGSGGAGPTATGGVSAAPTPRGVQLDDDLTRWEFWWEFGKDPFLRLREAVYAGSEPAGEDFWLDPRSALRERDVKPPTAADRTAVADRLVGLLQQETNRDSVSACLVALAKIGRDGADWRLRDVVVPLLARGDQEIRETAALALGISGRLDADVVDTLVALLADDTAGRRLSGGTAVNERTRAFAAFGLGLLLQKVRDPGAAHRVTRPLVGVLERAEEHGREVLVAVIAALSQFPRAFEGAAAQSLRGSVVDALGTYYDRPLGPGDQLVQAHVPTALGRMLSPKNPLAVKWRDRFAGELHAALSTNAARRRTKVNPHVDQSIAIALGALSEPWQGDEGGSAPTGQLLVRVFGEHKDHQTRWFAVQALGRMGGERSQRALLGLLRDANRALETPWIAIALGVQQARSRSRAAAEGESRELDDGLARELRAALKAARNPSSRAAIALALGLMGDELAGDVMRSMLLEVAHQDDLAGYLSIGLGLMRDPLAVGEVRTLLARSARRPQIVLHCAQALGLLGDHSVVEQLCAELRTDTPSLVRLSAAASALGQIGDRRALAPLLQILDREDITPLTRAFAVVALGTICDPAPLPWNSAYASGCNYRAATSTLTDGAAGILDIL